MAKSNKNFESKLEKFQTIINDLDNGNIPLEEQLIKYEEGMNLAAELNEYLNKAEMKIIDITKKFSNDESI